jgi:hypothetical protein
MTDFFNVLGSSGYGNKYSSLYNNQFFDYLGEQLPTDVKSMFQWCELIYMSSPVITNGIKKLISYPITEFSYESDADKIKDDTRELLTSLDMKRQLLSLGLDWYLYGNGFRSIYFPFTRYLKCTVCDSEVNIEDATYRIKRNKFYMKCPKCHTERRAGISDKDINDPKQVKLISWNPKNIDLSYNEITEDTDYYYSMPKALRLKIVKGDPHTMKTIPAIFVKAASAKRLIALGSNFYHTKVPSATGQMSGWGVPPLASSLKTFLFSAVLRKSMEAIGMEQINPKYIVFPQASSGDPTLISSMATWKSEITDAFKKWRRDPNYVMTAPYPTGIVNLGSQARSLMPSEEIKQADRDMLMALDIPLDFVYGTTNINNSMVSLRLLENQLESYSSQMVEYVNWVIDMINYKFDKEYCHVKLTPFRLIDDLVQKQALLNLTGSMVSRKTVQESFNLDPEIEDARIFEEKLNEVRKTKEFSKEQAKIELDIANQAQEEELAEQQGTISPYNQQKLIAQAQMQAQQLLQVPYEQRRSVLAQLQNEDYVMWALVSKQMETISNSPAYKEQQADTAQPADNAQLT